MGEQVLGEYRYSSIDERRPLLLKRPCFAPRTRKCDRWCSICLLPFTPLCDSSVSGGYTSRITTCLLDGRLTQKHTRAGYITLFCSVRECRVLAAACGRPDCRGFCFIVTHFMCYSSCPWRSATGNVLLRAMVAWLVLRWWKWRSMVRIGW